jgi:hypothetical protein
LGSGGIGIGIGISCCGVSSDFAELFAFPNIEIYKLQA